MQHCACQTHIRALRTSVDSILRCVCGNEPLLVFLAKVKKQSCPVLTVLYIGAVQAKEGTGACHFFPFGNGKKRSSEWEHAVTRSVKDATRVLTLKGHHMLSAFCPTMYRHIKYVCVFLWFCYIRKVIVETNACSLDCGLCVTGYFNVCWQCPV